MEQSAGSSVDVGFSFDSSESNLGSPNGLGMVDESARSTPSFDSSFDTGFDSNGSVPTSPIPNFQMAFYLGAIHRHEDIAVGIISATMPLLAMRNMIPVPPAGRFNRTAAMIGRAWMPKSQSWPIDKGKKPVAPRPSSPGSRATSWRAWLMEIVQRDIET